jgi:hypothetical protein
MLNLTFDTAGHLGFQRETYVTTTDPGVNNDSADTAAIGVTFRAGDEWLNTTDGHRRICVDATPTSAVWAASSAIEIPHIGAATENNLDDFIRIIGSTGRLSGGLLSAGAGVVDIAAGSGYIRETNDHGGVLRSFDWSASAGNSVPLNTVRFIGIIYNAGTPVVDVRTAEDWNYHTEFPLGKAINEGGTVRVVNVGIDLPNATSHLYERLNATEPIIRDSADGGLIISVDATTMALNMTAGNVWRGLSKFPVAVQTAATYHAYYGDGAGGFSAPITGLTSIPVTGNYYDNPAGTLAALAVNKYYVFWIYNELSGDGGTGTLAVRLPTVEYTVIADALDEGPPPSNPDHITEDGILLGRVLVRGGTTTAERVESAFGLTFNTTGVTNHNNLGGLQGGTGAEYYHLTSAEHTEAQSIVNDGIRNGDLLVAPAAGTSTLTSKSADAAAHMIVDAADSTKIAYYRFAQNGVVKADIYTNAAASPDVVFRGYATGLKEAFRIKSGIGTTCDTEVLNNLSVGGGITLGGGTDVLDAYEEGTFTATLTAATPPTTPPTVTGYYTKIGNLVNVDFYFQNVDTTGGSGDLIVSGLPFSATSTGKSLGSVFALACLVNPGATANVVSGTSTLNFTVTGTVGSTDIIAGAGSYLRVSLTYRTA